MATTEKVGIFTHVDDKGNTMLLYPVTKMEAVDGLPEAINALTTHYTVQLPANKWSEQYGVYCQIVEVAGITANDEPHWNAVCDLENKENREKQMEAYAAVSWLLTEDESILFVCDEDKPTVDLTIRLEVNR